MKKSRKTELRVGIFVVVALVIGGTLAFVIGSQRNMFSSKLTYHAIFDNVMGLRPGNAVQIAGVSVGTVDEVSFRDDGRVVVRFRVVADASRLIRGNPGPEPEPVAGEPAPEQSEVMIGSKGMLGDRQLDISTGDLSLPEWPVEQPIPVGVGGDLMATLASLGEKAEGVIANIEVATETLGDPQLNADVRETMTNLARFTGMLAGGDGAIQRLMTDPQTAEEIDVTLRNLRQTSEEFRRTSRSFRGIAQEIERGDGSAHQLIYGNEGTVAVENIGRASGEVAQLLEEVRTGDGMVHDLIYEQEGQEMLANLTRATDDLAAVTADIRAGRGTLGGLLTDPSIYEDIKRLVGDLQRNDILRALVRYSIRRDESAESTTATEE